jgi:hypothetical protein
MPTPPAREGALLVHSNELSWRALTSDQARILYRVVQENRANIKHRWSPGIFDGLSESLGEIERAGGAYVRSLPTPSFGGPHS